MIIEAMMPAKDAPLAPSAPRPARRAICAECGEGFDAARPQQQFCQPAHKTAFQNRQAVEGRAIIALAKAWRASRNFKGAAGKAEREMGGEAFSELCSILDSFISSDRAAARPAPGKYARSLLANGTRFCDRARKAR